MSLESLVPPLEMCQQLQPGDFPESAMVWAYTGNGYEVTSREVWGIVESIFPAIQAPASDEIMEKLPIGTILQQDEPGVWVCIVHGGEPGIMIEKADNPATAALRLWLKLKGIEVK